MNAVIRGRGGNAPDPLCEWRFAQVGRAGVHFSFRHPLSPGAVKESERVTTTHAAVDVESAKPPDRRLRRCQRLTATSEFEETYSQGRSRAGRYMVLWVRHGAGASLRLGVVASRRIGKAVQRNRAKRRLREAWRINRHYLAGDCDVVLVARRNILTARWPDIVDELAWLTQKAGLHV